MRNESTESRCRILKLYQTMLVIINSKKKKKKQKKLKLKIDCASINYMNRYKSYVLSPKWYEITLDWKVIRVSIYNLNGYICQKVNHFVNAQKYFQYFHWFFVVFYFHAEPQFYTKSNINYCIIFLYNSQLSS